MKTIKVKFHLAVAAVLCTLAIAVEATYKKVGNLCAGAMKRVADSLDAHADALYDRAEQLDDERLATLDAAEAAEANASEGRFLAGVLERRLERVLG